MRLSIACSLLLPALALSSSLPPTPARKVIYVAYETRFGPRPTNGHVAASELPQWFYLENNNNKPGEQHHPAAEATPEVAEVADAESPTQPTTTPAPDVLELRAEVVNPAASQGASQLPSITSYWVETVLGSGITTWVEVFYTQAFASVPDQGQSPGAGEIGMGTLTGEIGVVRTHNAAPAGSRLVAGRSQEAWMWGGVWSIVGTLMGAIVVGARMW